MAAAVAAFERGLKRVALIEREAYLGGVLPQCIHDGFGLHLFKHSYTGPEYAAFWQARTRSLGIEVFLQTTVLGIKQAPLGADLTEGMKRAKGTKGMQRIDCVEHTKGTEGFDSTKGIDCMDSVEGTGCAAATYLVDVIGSALGGQVTLETLSVIVATGCRERTRGQLLIPGTRPAGVLTAGTAQYMINIKDQLPGDSVVILGSGDIGLIMARRLTLEGAKVKMVLGQEATGLLRNHISCVQDFGIPLRYGWGVVSLTGRGQLHGVNIAPIKVDGSFDLEQKMLVRCNVLLIACGLITEREILAGISAEDKGIFVCGNARKPMDLVDQVSKEGILTGLACAEYVTQAFEGACLRQVSNDLMAMSSLSIEEPKGSVAEILGTGFITLSDDAQGNDAQSNDTSGDHVLVDGIRSSHTPGDALRSNHVPVKEAALLVVCTLCPTGCVLRVSQDDEVQGQACNRGKHYALAEVKAPLCIFTGTVRAKSGCLVAVRSAQEVPRELLIKIADACKRVRNVPHGKEGEILSINVEGTQIDLITAAQFGS